MAGCSPRYRSRLFFTLILLIIINLVPSARGLDCYQCESTDSAHPFLCNEFLTEEFVDEMEPQSCDRVWDAKYCIKRVGRFEGGIGTTRFCSSVDLGNYCDYVQQPGDQLLYRTCVYTCDYDGCNLASTLSSSRLLSTCLCSTVLGFFLTR